MNAEMVLAAAIKMIEGYGFFNREIAEEAGREVLKNNPWMVADVEAVRDWMIYKLTGEAP
jgi:hypothetical protein